MALAVACNLALERPGIVPRTPALRNRAWLLADFFPTFSQLAWTRRLLGQCDSRGAQARRHVFAQTSGVRLPSLEEV